MSVKLYVQTEIRVLEEDKTMCSLDCQHLAFGEDTAAKCLLYDAWLYRSDEKTHARCFACTEDATWKIESKGS